MTFKMMLEKVGKWWNELKPKWKGRIIGFIIGYFSLPACVLFSVLLFLRPFDVTDFLLGTLQAVVHPFMIAINTFIALIGAAIAFRSYGKKRWQLKLTLSLLVIAAIIGLIVMIFTGKAGYP